MDNDDWKKLPRIEEARRAWAVIFHRVFSRPLQVEVKAAAPPRCSATPVAPEHIRRVNELLAAGRIEEARGFGYTPPDDVAFVVVKGDSIYEPGSIVYLLGVRDAADASQMLSSPHEPEACPYLSDLPPRCEDDEIQRQTKELIQRVDGLNTDTRTRRLFTSVLYLFLWALEFKRMWNLFESQPEFAREVLALVRLSRGKAGFEQPSEVANKLHALCDKHELRPAGPVDITTLDGGIVSVARVFNCDTLHYRTGSGRRRTQTKTVRLRLAVLRRSIGYENARKEWLLGEMCSLMRDLIIPMFFPPAKMPKGMHEKTTPENVPVEAERLTSELLRLTIPTFFHDLTHKQAGYIYRKRAKRAKRAKERAERAKRAKEGR